MKITAIVLTKNEENNITRCLATLNFADEIIVVDDESTDKTKVRILEFSNINHKNIKIYNHALDGDFSAQRNWAMEKAGGDWILFLDADEEITGELKDEILAAVKTKNINGIKFKRNDFFLGKWLKHGETEIVELTRIVKKGEGGWSGRVHEVLNVKNGKIVKLNASLLHYPHKTLSEFLREINIYSTIRAEELNKKGVRTNILLILLYPKVKFIQNYIFSLGFMDGMPGLILALCMSFHSFLVRSKLYLMNLK